MVQVNPYCELTEGCENPKEGSTIGCASCNAALRKATREFSKPVKDRKSVKKFSPKRKEQTTAYAQAVKIWIVGKRCACCGDPATECHHKKGRTNDLLMEKKYWLPVCSGCHRLITEDSAWALKNGYSLLRST